MAGLDPVLDLVEPMPPTPKPGQGYKIVDPTKNKSGRP